MAISGGGVRIATPRRMKPSWRTPVCRVCLAKPETNAWARPRKARQRENPQPDPKRIFGCRDLPAACLDTRLSGQTSSGTFKQRFRHSPKDPDTLSSQEGIISPGLLVQSLACVGATCRSPLRGHCHPLRIFTIVAMACAPPPSVQTGRESMAHRPSPPFSVFPSESFFLV
jgi:hypothetical protein